MKQAKTGKTAGATPKPTVLERGINLDVPGSALAAQAAQRIAWHKDNVARIKAELSAIGTAESAGTPKQSGRLTDLTRLMLAHEEHARFLSFVKQHLKPRQVYRIGFADMMALELTPKGSCL